MKLSLSMWSMVESVRAGKMNLMRFIDFAASQPVAGVELLDYFWRDEKSEIPAVKKKLADTRLELAVYSISNDFFQPDAGARQLQLADLKRGVDVANELGVSLVRVFSGSYREGYSPAQGLAWIIEGLAAGAAYAERNGVTLALENHGLFAGRSEQVRSIIEQVNSPALRANLDTGNFLLAAENPLAAAQNLVDLVALAHLKDFRYAEPNQTAHVFESLDGKRLIGSALGDGLVDLEAIIATLDQAGYSGWLSLEYEGPDPMSGVPQSLLTAETLLARR